MAINRAAIAEAQADPTLAQTLASAGRDATLPAFVGYLDDQRHRGALAIDDASAAATEFLGLLIGDSQVRRLLGVLPAPNEKEIDARAAKATRAFLRLYAGENLR